MRLPLTLRVAYYSVRATVRAALLFLCAWLILIPANPAEVAALGATEGTRYPTGLRPMRAAKFIITWAPPQAYSLIALALGPEASPIIVRAGLGFIAAGNVLPDTVRINSEPESDRDIAGPRFIKVD